MKNKLLLVLIGLAIIGTIGFFFKEKLTMGAMIYPATFTNLIGSRVASTTTGVAWYDYGAASTTYPFALLGSSEATIVFSATNASSSAYAGFSILGSNDPNCSTATTTTIFNLMTKAQVRWFDATPFLDNAALITSFSNTTTTLPWVNPSLNQRALHFTDLNMEFLAVEVNASSTVLYGQYKLKD